MKLVTMMILSDCPHCRRAFALMDELKEAHPEYREVPVKIVEEDKEPAFAAALDYWYVPTYFVGDQKIHEGVPSREAIEAVYQAACSD